MGADRDATAGEGANERMLLQLDRMVDAGRVTKAEAERLRAAADQAELDTAAGAIRARHAAAKLEAAVARGGLSRCEADDILQRLRAGEHSASFRQRVRAAAGRGATDRGAGSARPQTSRGAGAERDG